MSRQHAIPSGYLNQTSVRQYGIPAGYINETATIPIGTDANPTFAYEISSVSLTSSVPVTPAQVGYQIESVALSGNLSVTPAQFGYQIESVALTGNLPVTPAQFGYQIKSVALTPTINVSPSTYGDQIESVMLIPHVTVVPSTYGFQITNPYLTQHHFIGAQSTSCTFGYQIESSPLLHFAPIHFPSRIIPVQPWFDRLFIAKRNPGLAKIGVKYGLDRIIHVADSRPDSRSAPRRFDVRGTFAKTGTSGIRLPIVPPTIRRAQPDTFERGWQGSSVKLIAGLNIGRFTKGWNAGPPSLLGGLTALPATFGWQSSVVKLVEWLLASPNPTIGFTVSSPTLSRNAVFASGSNMTMGDQISTAPLTTNLGVVAAQFGSTIESAMVVNTVPGTRFKTGFTTSVPSLVQTLRPKQSDYAAQIESAPIAINLVPANISFGFRSVGNPLLVTTAGTTKNVFGQKIRSAGLTFTNVLPVTPATFGIEVKNAPLTINLMPNSATFGKQVADNGVVKNLKPLQSDYGREQTSLRFATVVQPQAATFGTQASQAALTSSAVPAAATFGYQMSVIKLVPRVNTLNNQLGYQMSSPALTQRVFDVGSLTMGYQIKQVGIVHNLKIKNFTQGYQLASAFGQRPFVGISPLTKGTQIGTPTIQRIVPVSPATFGKQISSVSVSVNKTPGGKVLSIYLAIFPTVPTVAQILASAPEYNMLFGFVAQGAHSPADGTVGFSTSLTGNADSVQSHYIAGLSSWKASGRTALLSIAGGQPSNFVMLTATNVTQFINSVIPIIDTYGFQGIDWDLEGGTSQFTQATVVSASQQLKAHYGSSFLIHAAPRPFELRSGGVWRPIIPALGVNIDLVGPQWYGFGTGFDIVSLISSDTNDFIGNNIVPANKLLIGVASPSDGGGYSTSQYVTAYNNENGTYGIRGVYMFQAASELANGYPYAKALGPVVLGVP